MKTSLSFTEISQRLQGTSIPQVDLVVGILQGGRIPACLVAHQIQRPLRFVHIRFRDEENQPSSPEPELIVPPDSIPDHVGSILLVDDVSVTGKTMSCAAKCFPGKEIVTLVMKGTADVVILPEIENCVTWPWNAFEEMP